MADVVWQSDGHSQLRHRHIVDNLIAGDISLIVGNGIFQIEVINLMAVTEVDMARMRAETGFQSVEGAITLMIVADGQ